MFNPTSSTSSPANAPAAASAVAAAAAINALLEESGYGGQRNPLSHQQKVTLATLLIEQQQNQQRPTSAHSASSMLMHQSQASPPQQPPIQLLTQTQMEPLSLRKLFIGGLGQINDDALRQYYSQWGQVVDCIVIRDPATRSSRGFGFVTYATAEMAEAAISHRPHIINGKAVDAKRAVPREKMNLIGDNDIPPTFLSVESTPGSRLQLSGLNWEWHTLDTLRAHFQQFGNVEQLEMVAYPRGYGSLAFDAQDAVERCMAVGTVHNVNGHPVEIKIATADSLAYHPTAKDHHFHSGDQGQWTNGGGTSPNTTTGSPDGSAALTASAGAKRSTKQREHFGPPSRAESNGSVGSASAGTSNSSSGRPPPALNML